MSAPLKTRERLTEVRYEIRGELARRARELEAQGRTLIGVGSLSSDTYTAGATGGAARVSEWQRRRGSRAVAAA